MAHDIYLSGAAEDNYYQFYDCDEYLYAGTNLDYSQYPPKRNYTTRRSNEIIQLQKSLADLKNLLLNRQDLIKEDLLKIIHIIEHSCKSDIQNIQVAATWQELNELINQQS